MNIYGLYVLLLSQPPPGGRKGDSDNDPLPVDTAPPPVPGLKSPRMVNFQNYTRLPVIHQRAVYAMCRLMNDGWDDLAGWVQWHLLAEEAVDYRRRRGWFVWEDTPPTSPASVDSSLLCYSRCSSVGSTTGN